MRIEPDPNKPTRYRGYYRTVRDGKRVGITFTYETKNHDGCFHNEKEESVVTLAN